MKSSPALEKFTNIPKYIIWRSVLDKAHPADYFSSKKITRISKTEELLTEQGFHFVLEDISPKRLQQFVTVYEQEIGKKEQAEVHDIAGFIKERQQVEPFPTYKILALVDDKDELWGGLIFSTAARSSKQMLRIAFRFFPLSIQGNKYPIAVAYVAEYKIIDFALSEGLPEISHGMDRNLYGIELSPGLAQFKLGMGYKPFVAKNEKQLLLDWEMPKQNSRDVIVFHGATEPFAMFPKAHLILYKTPPELISSSYGSLLKETSIDTTIVDMTTKG